MRIINTTDLIPPGWRFIEPQWSRAGTSWDFVHGVPQNALERLVRRPNLARYRAARQAARLARGAQAAQERPVLVSHLPRMAAATNAARAVSCPDVPHMAFAFNFTDLPAGADLGRLRRLLKTVDAFAVFSRMELALYPPLLDLDPERFHFVPWAMDPPEAGPQNPMAAPLSPQAEAAAPPYLCAVGGEARDYPLLAQAMAALPHLRMAVVARPHSIAGISFSDNVTVFTNLPAPQTWALVQGSLGLVVPLRSAETACGHITIVGAQLLGVPLAVTASSGVADYVDSDDIALRLPAGDLGALRAALETLAEDRAAARARAGAAQALAAERSAPAAWVRFFEDRLDALGRG